MDACFGFLAAILTVTALGYIALDLLADIAIRDDIKELKARVSALEKAIAQRAETQNTEVKEC